MKKGIVLAITAIIVMSVVFLASCDPKKATGTASAEAKASVKAAEAVQKAVVAIQTEANAADEILKDGTVDGLNAETGAKRKKAKTALEEVTAKLENMGDDSVMKLSEAAVAAAKKVKGFDTKDSAAAKAVKAAEAVKELLDVDAETDGLRMTAKTSAEAFTDGEVVEGSEANGLVTLKAKSAAVKKAVDDLKMKADAAVTAAKAVK